MKFKSDIKEIKKLDLPHDFKHNQLPQLYRADIAFAKQQNDNLINAIIAQLPEHPEYKYVSIDTRTHMLMTGMYPCIPGWHCDDFYRSPELNGQPDLQKVHEVAPAIHYMLIIGDNSKTEFLMQDVDLPSPEDLQSKHGREKPVYYLYDQMIENDMAMGFTKTVEPGMLYSFGPTAFHRGKAATHNGWRFFMRITFSNHREAKNEIRYQTQVYTDGKVSW